MPGILDNNLRRIGWLFTLCVAWGLILPVLMAKGMFSDAVLYAAVAHNMAKGIGSFWFPFFDTYNVIGISSFHEQPPLAFGIESIFFRILGDSDLVERFYTFLLLGIHMILIAGMWKTMTKKVGGFESVSWLPVLFWITIPVCFWSFSNNMNENTMGVFDVLAVWLAWIFMKNKSAADGFLSAICIVLAALSKGFPGLFPLAVPAIYWIVYREGGMGYAIRKSAFLFGIVLIVFLLVLLYEPARDSLSIYLFQRAFQRISDAHTVQSRYFILIRLFTELLPMMAVAVLFWSGFKLRRVSFSIPFGKESLFFLLCGLSGTLPLMLTLVQNGFYMVHALFCFGLSAAFLLAVPVQRLCAGLVEKHARPLFVLFTLILGSIVLFSFSRRNSYSRNKELLTDIEILAKHIPPGSRMWVSDAVYENWSLSNYLVRFHQLSVASYHREKKPGPYFLTLPQELPPAEYHYVKQTLPLTQFDLYRETK